MNKFEPLKNKVHLDFECDCVDNDNPVEHYNQKDVLSAIKWLKEKIIITSYKDVSYIPTINLIDEAFEDVMKVKK